MSVEIVTKEDLQIFKTELLEELKTFVKPGAEQKTILKSEDVRKLLNISPGSLQTLRTNGILSFSKVGGTIYYEYAEVMKVLNKNKKEAIK